MERELILIAGRYSLDREIGRGGMGAVWLGRDEVLGRAVALKKIGIMPGGTTPDLDRAEREARLAARLNHPHVVAIFDLVTEHDHQWLVMEYVEGATLAELVRSGGPLTPDQAAPILRQVADALAAAHGAGIIHRDVKPSNILVTEAGQVKLSDFGIARAEADASLTQTGLVTGSPAYLAPEVASGSSATEASDVWSLGATLFHALSGHPPYDVGENLLGALYRIVHEEPPRLANAGWLSPLLDATMTRDPADRWTMAQVGEFLKAGPPLADVRRLPAPPIRVGQDPNRTQVLARPLASPPSPTTTPTLRPARRRGSRLMPFLIGVPVLVLLVVIAFAVALGGDGDGNPGTSSPTGNSSSPSDNQGDVATEAGMTSFVEDYLATVTSDPATAWTRLTPAFQEQSGRDKYTKFWGRVDSATATDIVADPGTLQVSYQVDYLNNKGPRESSDHPTLQLVYDGGVYLIDGER